MHRPNRRRAALTAALLAGLMGLAGCGVSNAVDKVKDPFVTDASEAAEEQRCGSDGCGHQLQNLLKKAKWPTFATATTVGDQTTTTVGATKVGLGEEKVLEHACVPKVLLHPAPTDDKASFTILEVVGVGEWSPSTLPADQLPEELLKPNLGPKAFDRALVVVIKQGGQTGNAVQAACPLWTK